MATFLYRLGRFSYRRRWVVVGVWALVFALLGLGGATLSKPTSNTFTIPGTQSQKALDLLAQRMPGSGADGATARVVFLTKDGAKVTDPAVEAKVESTVAALKALPRVASVADPYTVKTISRSLDTAYATVTYSVQANVLTTHEQNALLATARSADGPRLQVEIGGDAVKAKIGSGATEGLGVIVAGVVLVITFGSLLAAGLPLVTALVGVGAGTLGIKIATGFFTMSSTSGILATMLGLAVAIDYSLFIVSRYRHELLGGHEGPEAAGRAIGTAGSAVVFAGATVVIALGALSVVGIPFLTAMGLAAAGTVAGAVLIALTLLPALLAFLGERVLGRRGRRARDTDNDMVAASGRGAAGRNASGPDVAGGDAAGRRGAGAEPMGARWARIVVRHRVPVLLVVVLGLGALALPATVLRLGLPSDGTASTDTTQRRAYDAVAQGFGPGFNGPLVVVADLARAADPKTAATTIERDLVDVRGVAYSTPARFNAAGNMAIYTLIPTTGPADAATETLVHQVRADAAGWNRTTGASVYVTGTTAVGIDVSQTLQDALLPYLAVVVGLAFLLLLLVFRSIVVPLKATGGFLLSMAAAIGAVVAVFQKGWGGSLVGVDTPGPILSFLPIMVIGLLFGLAMDYEVFLVTRMREEYVHGATAGDAVVLGFRHGARVVTAAAVIMISVFGGFALTDDPTIKAMGFGLAAGVFFDAFLIRMTLVPAVMSLLGDKAWWIPRWLDRILPDVDVEGDKLRKVLAARDARADGDPNGTGGGSPADRTTLDPVG